MKKKKLKLKKNVVNILIVFLFVIILVVALNGVINNYKYKKTTEYKLLDKGYSKEEVKSLSTKLNEEDLNTLANESKNSTVLSLIEYDNFKKDNLQRYLDYLKKSKFSIEEVILMVNVNRDKEYYENPIETDISKGKLMLVNKYYYLPEDFEPENLVKVSAEYSWANGAMVTKEVYDAFIRMFNDAKKEGHHLMIRDGYRSFEDQKELYDSYKTKNGAVKAEKDIARPGYCEHQTGLALDILELHNATLKTFKDTEVHDWLIQNSYKYGFIPRYEEDTQMITGFEEESYHFRYVGLTDAGKIHEKDITFEEYYINEIQ